MDVDVQTMISNDALVKTIDKMKRSVVLFMRVYDIKIINYWTYSDSENDNV